MIYNESLSIVKKCIREWVVGGGVIFIVAFESLFDEVINSTTDTILNLVVKQQHILKSDAGPTDCVSDLIQNPDSVPFGSCITRAISREASTLRHIMLKTAHLLEFATQQKEKLQVQAVFRCSIDLNGGETRSDCMFEEFGSDMHVELVLVPWNMSIDDLTSHRRGRSVT
jgi:hypothetical protein